MTRLDKRIEEHLNQVVAGEEPIQGIISAQMIALLFDLPEEEAKEQLILVLKYLQEHEVDLSIGYRGKKK